MSQSRSIKSPTQLWVKPKALSNWLRQFGWAFIGLVFGAIAVQAAAPTIAAIPDQTVVIDRPTDAYHLTVADAETPELSLVLRGLSSNTNLVPTNNIFFGVAFNTWYLTVTPKLGQTGTSTISIIVRDQSGLEATNSFLFTATGVPSGYSRFVQTNAIQIPGVANVAGSASPYPSTNTVTGMSGWITNMTMTFSGFTHDRIQDVNMLLVSPSGAGVVLFSEISGQNRKCTNVTVTFDDDLFYALPQDYDLWSEPLRPANFQSTNFYPGATWTNSPVALSSFYGASPNGNWMLYVYDDTAGNNGVISNGWSLLIATATGPFIGDFTNRTILTNTSTGPIGFYLNDPDTQLSNIVLFASSSNTNLVTTNNIVFGGSGTNRTVSVTPNANQAGVSTITIFATDGAVTNSRGFLLTVSSGNLPPTIAAIPDKTVLIGRAAGPFNLTISDPETPTGSLILSASSSNTNLVPNANLIPFNSGVQTLVVQPVDGQVGSSVITVSVSDGLNVTSTNFNFTVIAAPPGTGIFNATSVLSFPLTNVASVYPSTNVVSGMVGNITSVTLTLKGLTHTAPNNLEMLLVSPGGQKSALFSHVSGGPTTNVTVTLDETATYQLPPSPYTLLTGTYKSANFGNGTFPSPAPAGPYSTNLLPFAGVSPNGNWLLYIVNDPAGTGSGVLSNGWSLAITTDSSNAAPTISAISDQVTTIDTPTAAIPFTISDLETAPSSLVLTALSSNPTLIPTNNIAFGGSGSNRTVTLAPASGQFGAATLRLLVSDGTTTTSNSFQLFVSQLAAGTGAFSNTAAITVPLIGTANPYPSTNTVSGLGGTITNLSVRIRGLSHTWTRDVDMLLVSPWGQALRLMENAGSGAVSGVSFNLTNSGASLMPTNTSLTSVTYLPSAFPTNAIYPAPAPTGPYLTNLAGFNGVSANGNWLLYVKDHGANDSGIVSNGWVLNIQTAITGPQTPTLTDLLDQSIPVSANTGPMPFTINDLDTAISNLTVTGFSSNTNLVPNSAVVFSGSGSNRTVTVTPTPALAGNSTITVVVSDGTLSATNTFLLTVSSPATQLRLETSADGSGTVISNQTLLIGTPLTAYTITRDAYGNFVSNVVASSWALANTVGGVVASNLVVAGDSRSATFTGTAPGTGKVRATSGSFAAVSTGYLNVYNSGNFPPVISPIANRTTLVGRAVGPFDITVSDAETATGSLIITASSSNTNLVPNSNFVIFNSGVTTFTVQPADGQTGVTTITVTVSDGVNTSSTDFDLTVLPSGTGVGVFDKPALITLPQTNVASAYPLTNVVSGLLGNITKVSVTFKGLTHSFPHDLEMLLVGPGGQKSVFMSQAGGGSANNYTVTIDDTTQYALPPYPYTILTGTYKSADFGHGTFPSPAPAGPYAADMSTFIGSAPNGTWSLYILNGAGTTGSGVISNGWSLAVYTDVTNSAPTITAISNRVTTVNTATAAIPFTITDAETAASNLVLTASSSNTNLVSANGIVFGGSGTNRTVTVTPSSNQLGSATLTLTVSDGQLSASTNFQLTVNPAPLTITASNFSRGYGLTNPVLTGSIVGLQAGDNITANFTTTATTNSPLGTYPITFTLNDPGNKLGNYTITTNNGTLTVTNALLTVTASNSNKVYGTSRTFAGTEFALTSGTLFNGNTITNVTLSSAGATNTAPIGAYPIAATNATGSGLSNYKITYVTGALTVTTAPLTVTANSTNKVYGVTRTFAGTEFTVTSGALVNGDTLTSATLASAGALSNAPAGAYAITVTNAIGLGASNYAISYVAGTLTVNSASLLITAGSTNKTYGATLNPSAYTVAGLLNGDSVTNLTLASAGSVSNAAVGAYSIVPNAALGVGLTNYTIGYSNGTLTVNAANLLITAGNTNKIYGSTLVPLAYSVSGLLNNDSVTNILQTTSGSVSNAPVGSYSIVPGSAQGHGLTNYTIGYSNGTLTVSPANLLITAGSTNKIYGSTLVPLAYTVAGLVNSDSVTNVSLNSAGAINTAPVGTYPITASGAQGLGLTNYSIGYSNGALTVSGAALLISAGNTNKTYGSTLAPVTYTVIGLLNADSVTNLALTSLGSVSNAPVGSYSITPSLAQGSGLTNYAIGYSNGTFTVNAASLSITAGNTNKPYGSTLNPTAYAVAGLLNGDAVTNVTLNSSGSVSNAPVGSYPIVASAAVGFGLTNYVIGYTDGTLTVNSASLLITAASTNKVYGATLSPTEYAVAGLLNGDSVTNVALTSAGSASSAPAGSYTILASAAAGVGLTNYAIAYASGTMTVNPASLLVNIASTNKIYGATLNPVDYSIAGLLNSDSVTNVVLTSTGSAATAPAGAHVITASVIEGVGLTNYSVILSNGVLTVNPASLLITAQGTNKTYGVTLVPSTYNVNGLLNSDSVTNVTLASAGASADAPVGSYLITPSTASGLGLTNYAIGYSNGTLSVNAAGLLITTVSTNKNYGVTLNPTAYTVSGLLNGDSVTNVVLASGGSVSNAPVGSYGITAALVEGSGLTNYAIGYSNGVLSVGYA
ncbi:MAG: hypothetical protein RLY20_894, partial [Verrucomicrobiota bacterium]